MLALVHQRLTKELLNVLDVLLVDDLRKNAQSICLEHVVLRRLQVLLQTSNHNEDLVHRDVELLDQYVDKATQVLVQLVSLALRNLEELRDIEKEC